jgi:hypothetical protein
MSFWANVFWANVFLGECLSGQTSFWANVFWANVFLGKCLSGQMSSGQMSSGQMSFWANVGSPIRRLDDPPSGFTVRLVLFCIKFIKNGIEWVEKECA